MYKRQELYNILSQKETEIQKFNEIIAEKDKFIEDQTAHIEKIEEELNELKPPEIEIMSKGKKIQISEIRARACIKCQEYVNIEPDDPKNQEIIKHFEGNHRGHTLITLDLDELKGQYKRI